MPWESLARRQGKSSSQLFLQPAQSLQDLHQMSEKTVQETQEHPVLWQAPVLQILHAKVQDQDTSTMEQ